MYRRKGLWGLGDLPFAPPPPHVYGLDVMGINYYNRERPK